MILIFMRCTAAKYVDMDNLYYDVCIPYVWFKRQRISTRCGKDRVGRKTSGKKRKS